MTPMSVSYPQAASVLTTSVPKPTGLSYVPSVPGISTPQMPLGPSVPAEVLAPPPAPQRLTTGIPDPSAIEQQKQAYSQGLDEQLRQGAAILNQQLKQQMDQLHQLGDEQKKKYFVQVDHEIKSQELGLVQQFKEQLLMVQTAAAQQKRILGQQATALLLEYNQKKAQEDLLMEEYKLSKLAYDNQQRFNEEQSSLQQQQAVASQAAVAQQAAVEQHAAAAMLTIEEQRQQVAQQMAAQSKLVQSAESTAVATTAMYSGSPLATGYSTPMAMAPAPASVSYSPIPVTTAAQIPSPMSYSPAPATVVMPSVSYTPAPVAGYGGMQTVSVARPA